MTGFEIVDRYDFAMWLVLGVVMVGALALGAPLLLTVPVIMVVACVAGFIRHFDEIMGP
jgi:uncharacterized membrane protein